MNSTHTEKTHKLSYIEPHEEEQAKELVKQHLGFEPIRPAGYHILVMLYIRSGVHKFKTEEGEQEVNFIIPEQVLTADRWVSCVALVVAMGPDAYKHPKFGNSGPWCKVGDWIMIPRNEGIQFNDHGPLLQANGVPMQLVPDDRVIGIVDEPARIKREGQS